MGVGMHKTSSSKTQFTALYGNEDLVNCVAGAVITITPTSDFRLMRISLNFDANLAVDIEIEQDNNAGGAAWDQLIRRVAVPAPGVGLTTDYTLIGGQGYEYEQGDAIVITIAAVAMNCNASWEMEQT